MHTARTFVEPSLPAHFTRRERVAVYAPLLCTEALVCGLMMYGWISGRFAFAFYGFVIAMPLAICAGRLRARLVAGFCRRHARVLWTLVGLLVLMLPMHAFAQDVPGVDVLNGATGLSSLPAATPAPVDAATFDIFAPMYAGLLDGVDKIVADDAAGLIGSLSAVVVPSMSLMLITIGIVEALGLATAGMMRILALVIRFGIVWSIIGTIGDYTRYVIEPGMHMGDGLMATVNAATAGAPGHVWDVLSAHMAGATVQTIKRLPWSMAHPGAAMESGIVAGLAMVCLVVAWISLALTFIVYLSYAVYTAILLACGPILLFGFMFPPLKGWAFGWISALASQILGMLLLGIVMSIVVGVDNRQLDAVLNLADNVNVWGSLGHLAGGMVVLIVGAGLGFLTRGIAVSIVGGTYTAMDTMAIGLRGASGFGSMVSSGSGGGGYISAPSAGGSSAGQASAAMAIPHSAPGSVGNMAGNIRP